MIKKYLLIWFLIILAWCGANNSSNVSLPENKIKDKELVDIQKEEQKILQDNNIDDEWELSEAFDDEENLIIKKSDNNSSKNLIIVNSSTWDSNKKNKKLSLADLDIEKISLPKDCLKLNLSKNEKRQCILLVQDKILNDALSLDDCKKLLTKSYKLKCINKVYFLLAKDKKNISYCNYIKDDNLKQKCIQDIKHFLKSVKESQKTKNKETHDTIISNTDCSKLVWQEKYICYSKKVAKEKDLRYCNKLTGNFKNKCINENWNEVLKYNLIQAVQTKDKSYCDKIANLDRVKRCYDAIK